MADIKYQYAYNEEGKVVSINDFTKEESRLHTYKCIGCGNPLLPRAIGSNSRRAHFYHKEIVNCSGETYLHKLGKHLIKEKFDSSDSFFISYIIDKECNNKTCSYKNIQCQKQYEEVTYNLKDYYDTCTEETPIKNYIADLLLTNSKKPKTPPLLIEICVTHKCEDDKIKSGLKIIEITVKKEQDFDSIFTNNNMLVESSYDNQINFISFERKQFEPMEIDISRYIFNPQINDIGYLENISCKDAKYKVQQDSQVELNIVNKKNYAGADLATVFLWMYKNKNFRRCNFCKFYYATKYEDKAKCRLSKKYGKPMYPPMTEAEHCRSFHIRENSFEFSELKNFYIEEVQLPPNSEKNEFRVIIAGSSSFYDYRLFKEKCDFYLSSKIKTHKLTILRGTSKKTEQLIWKYCDENHINIEPYEAEWNVYGQQATYYSNIKKINRADALIAFWDEKSTATRDLIERAKAKGLKFYVVKIDSKTNQ